MKIAGVILAGGQSTRMGGGDKCFQVIWMNPRSYRAEFWCALGCRSTTVTGRAIQFTEQHLAGKGGIEIEVAARSGNDRRRAQRYRWKNEGQDN